MPHKSLDNITLGHRRNPSTGLWETEVNGEFVPASNVHALTLETLSPTGDAGDFTFIIGQQFQAVRRDDGSLFAFDTGTGKAVSGDLAPAAPADPAKPDITFFQDPNTGTFYALDRSSRDADGNFVLQVISEETPEVQQGFQHILEAALALGAAGLDPLRYDFVFEGGKVVPKLIEQIPKTQDSFSTATGADGQLLAVSRLTGTATPIGSTPKGDDIPPDATVELDPITKQFKITQPNGQISFLQAPVDIKLPQEVTIGGQSFAFNPNTGGFQQVQVTAQQFDPGVVVEGGRSFIQGPGGELTPLGREEVPNLDELINERILSGDAPGALALADFRDRPTSLEAFNAAMQFAQSPGDVAAISAISRGQTLVAPPPSGTVQRIAEQPEFLQDAFQRLINQFRGGSGSPEQFIDVLTRINKERDERGEKLAEAEERNRKLEREALLDPLRKQISDLEAQLGDPPPDKTVSISAATWGSMSGDQRLQYMAARGIDPAFAEVAFKNGVFIISGPAFDPVLAEVQAPAGAREPGVTFDPLTRSFTESTPGTITRVPTQPTGVSPDIPQETQAGRDQAFTAFNAPQVAPKTVTSEFGTQEEQINSRFTDIDDETFDFFAVGGTTHHPEHLEIVGEDGPELVQLPPGTNVIPNKDITPAQLKALKKMGVGGMQEGGIVDPLLPFGVRRALAGVIIEPTRRRLSRAAGVPVLSAQARQNLLPEELEVFNRLSREAGIPAGAFRQEQESAFPGANLARGRARFAPRVLR